MKISKKALAGALKLATMVVEKRSTIPVLSCVEITRAGPRRARLRGTDLDLMLDIEIECEQPPSAPLLINARALERAVREARADAIAGTLSNDGETISLSLGHIDLTLPMMTGHELPEISTSRKVEDGEGTPLFMAPKDMKSFLTSVEYAISSEATRYYLNGAYIHQKEGHICAVATNGHRLAFTRGPAFDEPFSGKIVMTKAVSVMKAILSQSESEEACLRLGDEDHLAVRLDTGEGIVLHAKTIDGTFPDYPRVIPDAAEASDVLEVDPIEFRAVCRSLKALIAAGPGGSSTAKLEPNGTGFYLSSHQPGEGRAKAHLPVLSGKPSHTLGFNLSYMIDALAGRRNSERLHIKSPSSPIIVGDPTADHFDVVMPLGV